MFMLSQKILDQSPGRHQRQNSTPSVFDTFDASFSPTADTNLEEQRRGMSLDQTITPRNAKTLMNQDSGNISIEHMFNQHFNQQNPMQEAQQQNQMARPGQQQIQSQGQTSNSIGMSGAMHESAQGLAIPTEAVPFLQNDHDFRPSPAWFEAEVHKLPAFGNSNDSHAVNLQQNAMVDPKKMSMGWHSRQGSQVSQSSGQDFEQFQPQTPKKQTGTSFFPMTPATTPFSQKVNIQQAFPSRTADSSPTRDPQSTIKASYAMQRGSSCQDNFFAMRQHAMSPASSPPRPASLQPAGSIDTASFPPPNMFNMSDLQLQVPAGNGESSGPDSSPMTKATSSSFSSFQSSPEMGNMTLFDGMDVDTDTMAERLVSLAQPSKAPSRSNRSRRSSPGKGHTHSRSQSVSETDDLEEIVENTGISQDDVASFISGPDADNRWKCLYSGCTKTFGRKENIKSHVQTHLGDRQFRCKQCNKQFVRQHDLKRHANIHTNRKIYTCPCTKEFARHDALTRHRQRNMCDGAIDETMRKVAKRGRPKKARPETEERLEKAAKTRQRVLERIAPGSNDASSNSSVSSHASPPQMFDNMSMPASSPPEAHQELPVVSDMDFFAFTPPMSPGFSTGQLSQPMSQQNSQQSHTSSMNNQHDLLDFGMDQLAQSLLPHDSQHSHSPSTNDHHDLLDFGMDQLSQPISQQNSHGSHTPPADTQSSLTAFGLDHLSQPMSQQNSQPSHVSSADDQHIPPVFGMEQLSQPMLQQNSQASNDQQTSPEVQALPMGRQESTASSESLDRTPPPLDLSSSSPATSKSRNIEAFMAEPRSPFNIFGDYDGFPAGHNLLPDPFKDDMLLSEFAGEDFSEMAAQMKGGASDASVSKESETMQSFEWLGQGF